jgi:GDP-L-fucose synthase
MCESYNLQYGTNFISVMPTNLYGPNDNFDLEKSHVLPALIRKIYLGKCLENNDWEKIRYDLDKLPIEGVNGSASKEQIMEKLNKYGILIKDNPTLANNFFNVKVEVWGTGKPLREFLWSEDMADACVFLMEKINFKDVGNSIANNEVRNTHINIGTGKEISIFNLTMLIRKIIGFKGEIVFNSDKPDGTMRKLSDVSKLHGLGWKHKVDLEDGIKMMFAGYCNET